MVKKTVYRQYLHIIILMAISISTVAQTNTNNFLLQNEEKLAGLKKQYKEGDAAVTKDINALVAEADKTLTEGPYSVTFHKAKIAPSGNPHDYVSQAPYWWADPSKPDGKPYIRKDGERNPEIYQLHDDSQLNELCQSVKKLGFAYYFTNKEEYAKKAAALLRVWFIDADTKMAPNLNYAQYIPGINDGRGIGIIESRALADIPDALAMMQGSKSLNNNLISGVKAWFAEYLKWLQNSKNGNDEHASKNNHGTYYDMQVVDFAIFTGDKKLALDYIKNQTIQRMDTQFTVDGRQPLELERTKSWGYSNMNLDGWCRLAVLADKLNINLWHTETKDGKGIKKCIEWLMPYLLKQKEWTYKQIEPFGYNETLTICSFAADKYPDIDFQAAFKMYRQPKPWM